VQRATNQFILNRSYLKDGSNYIQHINLRNSFPSIEGSYTFKTSDKNYHTVSYEVPLDLDYSTLIVKQYEIAPEENFFRAGSLNLQVNGTFMDVRYFVNSDGFHVGELQRQVVPVSQPQQQQQLPQQRPVAAFNNNINNVQLNNQRQQPAINRRITPTFSRPDLLTGERSVQPRK